MQNNQPGEESFSYNLLPKKGYSNSLHELKAVDPYQMAQQMRVMPRQLSTGSQRGEMTIQGKLVVQNPDTNERILIGSYDDEFGIFQAEMIDGDETNLNISKKTIGITDFWYDLDTGRNWAQMGKLPDGTFNLVITKDEYDVDEAFTS